MKHFCCPVLLRGPRPNWGDPPEGLRWLESGGGQDQRKPRLVQHFLNSKLSNTRCQHLHAIFLIQKQLLSQEGWWEEDSLEVLLWVWGDGGLRPGHRLAGNPSSLLTQGPPTANHVFGSRARYHTYRSVLCQAFLGAFQKRLKPKKLKTEETQANFPKNSSLSPKKLKTLLTRLYNK